MPTLKKKKDLKTIIYPYALRKQKKKSKLNSDLAEGGNSKNESRDK